MILYVLIGLILASFVIAFLSARTWHWGHVLVVLGIFLSTVGFFLLAAETLRINAVLRKQVNDNERQLAEVKAQNEALQKGTKDTNILGQLRNLDPPAKIPEDAESIPSLVDLDHELLMATRVRGRVWRKVAPAGVDPQTGAVRVSIESPVPAGLSKDTVVYLFEEGPAPPAGAGGKGGAQYLGEFRVSEAAAQQATLLPVIPMGAKDYEVQRLAASRGPWVIYEQMPVDRQEVFANLTDEQLKKIVPPQSIEEYLRNGKEAGPDDDEVRKVGLDENGVRLPADQLAKAAKVLYQRRLRDYATEFDELAQRRIVMLADTDAVKTDIQRLTVADESAKKLSAFRQDEIKRLNTDLAGVEKERQAIERHLAQVEQQLARVRELLASTLQRNSQLADELSARQLRPGRAGGGATTPAPPTGPLALGAVN